MPQLTNAALQERAKVNSLKPKLADVAKAMGKEIQYRTLENGKQEPYIKFSPNDGYGKTTREWGVSHEAMRPWVKAETERQAKANRQPGEYGLVGHGTLVLLGELNPLHFCPDCDQRWAWCECSGDKEV